MCTVTYLPLKSGFVLTSNRDEIISRASTTFPYIINRGGQKICFPRDPISGGSWIALSPKRTVCLLNGAFEKHERKSTYRKSRGNVLIDSYDFTQFSDFAEGYNFMEIEPFTMVAVVSEARTPFLYQLVWDGEKAHLGTLPAELKRIWSSATLYDANVRALRHALFENVDPGNENEVLSFHQTKSAELGAENSFIMSRSNGPCTISTAQVKQVDSDVSMTYFDYISNQTKREEL